MPSLQSQLIYFVLRNRHLLKFHLKKETWDWNTSITAFRQECEKGAQKAGKLPDDIDVEPVSIPGLADGLKAEWIRLSSPSAEISEKDPVIFYTHGGGYVSGTCSDHRRFVTKFVQGSGIPAFHFDYRLAPEHPFPAALEDSLTAYRWLMNQGFSPSRVVIAGESAGGGLCLAVLLALRDRGIPLPAAGVALSPWTDLKNAGKPSQAKAKSSIDPDGMGMVCSKYYAGDLDPSLPYISPLYGDLHRLPPLFISAGGDEPMRDDAIRFAEKATTAGVEVILRVGKGMEHCYPLFAPLFPEATQAMQEICAFIKKYIGMKIGAAETWPEGAAASDLSNQSKGRTEPENGMKIAGES